MSHPIPSLRRLLASAICTLAAFAPAGAAAQADSYPSRPVTLVVPFAPGGASDIAGRELAQRLSAALRQPVVVENRPGASGVTAASSVLNAPADGHTLLLMNSAKVVLKAMNPAVRYDPVHDFSTVSLFARIPTILVAPATGGIKDFAAFRAHLKARPDASWGSPGVGTAPHFAGATLMRALGSDAVHVSYKGSAPLQLDLLPGRITFAIDSYTALKPHIASGAVVPLAVPGHTRLAALPEVPTLTELGLREFGTVLYDGWNSIDVHKATPAPIVQRLNRELAAILQGKDLQDRLRTLDMATFAPHPTAEAERFVLESSRALSPLASNLKP